MNVEMRSIQDWDKLRELLGKCQMDADVYSHYDVRLRVDKKELVLAIGVVRDYAVMRGRDLRRDEPARHPGGW